MNSKNNRFFQQCTFAKPTLAVALALAAVSVIPGMPGDTVWAQNTNATIRGQVLDPTGALVPNAAVNIVNSNTGVQVFAGATDSAGIFVAPQVIPGTYRVTVTAAGLKTTTIQNLVATVSQVAAVNVQMEIGGATDVVTVESKGEQLDRATSNISTLISPQDVENLHSATALQKICSPLFPAWRPAATRPP